MRISDWSSDVCSSDLNFPPADVAPAEAAGPADAVDGTIGGCLRLSHRRPQRGDVEYAAAVGDDPPFGIAGSAGVKDHGSRPGGRIQSFYHRALGGCPRRSEEHTSELQSIMRISYDVYCLKKKNN